jgi:hypothetical protein
MLLLCRSGLAQGFENLDFEDTTVAPTPVDGYGGSVDPAIAFPGWTVGGSDTYVLYNNLTLGSPAVDLMGPNFPNAVGYTPLQGSYSALIYYDNPSIVPIPTLSQTGLVPANAQSISFLLGLGRGDPAVSLNGVNIPLVSISGGRVAGNISAFAGSVVQLTFTTSNDIQGDNFMYFDDIQFSSSSVPEPSGLALTALGALLLGFRRWSGFHKEPASTAARKSL